MFCRLLNNSSVLYRAWLRFSFPALFSLFSSLLNNASILSSSWHHFIFPVLFSLLSGLPINGSVFSRAWHQTSATLIFFCYCLLASVSHVTCFIFHQMPRKFQYFVIQDSSIMLGLLEESLKHKGKLFFCSACITQSYSSQDT